MTTIALENVLTKAGLNVKPSEFLALVEDAARRLKPPNPEPAHYLSPEQRAALEDVGLDLSPQSEDERDYRARTVAAHTVLAESALTVGEAAALLGVDDSRIRHRLKERRLTGWKAQGGWRLPNWQFTPSGVLPGLDVVLRAVPKDRSASAYGVGGVHRHTPEFIQNLSAVAGQRVTVSFTPVLAPMPRGILTTASAPLAGDADLDAVRAVYEKAYGDEPFVSVLPEGAWPTTAATVGSNMVLLQVAVDSEANRLVVVAAIDNLTKGTAGGAVQSMNIALGLDETTGLPVTGVAP